MSKIFSVLLILLIIFSSCGGEPTSGFTEFVFSNKSDHQISVNVYAFAGEVWDNFMLLEMEEETRSSDAQSGSGNGPLGISLYQAVDSITVIFDNTLLIHYDIGRLDGNPMRISNYELIEAEKEPYIYLFEFTNEDYERALERGRIIK